MAYIVKLADSQISAEELIEHCANTMSERAAIPKRIEFIDAMPLTAVGKIFRPTLRQQITETLVKEVLASSSISAHVASETEKKRGLIIRINVDDKSTIDATNTLFQNYIFTTEVI